MNTLRRAVISAARKPRFLPGGGSTIFSSYPLRKAWAALAVSLLLVGCTSAAVRNARAVARSENNRDYLEAKYEDVCSVANPPAPCADVQKALNVWLADIHRRNYVDWSAPKPSIPRTGPTPLHDAALVADEKSALKAAKKVLP